MLYALKHATTTTARVWARWPAGGTLSVVCNGATHGGMTLAAASDFSGVVEVAGLEPGRQYPFSVLIDGAAQDAGTLRSWASDRALSIAALRRRYTRCVNDSRQRWRRFAFRGISRT
jgi:hypothetical protein